MMVVMVVVVATMGRWAIVMSVDSNKLLLSDTPFKPNAPNTLYAHVFSKVPDDCRKRKR